MALRERTDALGLRDRKRAATQMLLRDTALRLFKERGYSGVSVDEIAIAADVSRSTFFRYFGSKEAVLFDEIDETGDVFLQHLDSRPLDESPWVAFAESVIAASELNEVDDRRSRQLILDDLLRNDPALSGRRLVQMEQWTETIAGIFARRRGRNVPEFEDRLAASTCMAVSEVVGQVWRDEGGRLSGDVIREAFATLRTF